MSVKVIRKQSGQANEVTDAMRVAGANTRHDELGCVTKIYKAMEAARIAEVGEIETVEIRQPTGASPVVHVHARFYGASFIGTEDGGFEKKADIININKENLIPLAEALLELGKQMKGAV